MQTNASEVFYCDRGVKRISQGDIIRELNLTISSKIEDSGDFSLAPSFSYGVVLSQECDIEQHYNRILKNQTEVEEKIHHDQIIETLLICPAFPSEQFFLGTHIKGKKMNDFQSPAGQKKALEKIQNNDQYERFHYLPPLPDKLPALIVDFKRFYTVPIGIFDNNFKRFYLTSIKELYRERLSQRFTNYLGRIGLPGGN